MVLILNNYVSNLDMIEKINQSLLNTKTSQNIHQTTQNLVTETIMIQISYITNNNQVGFQLILVFN